MMIETLESAAATGRVVRRVVMLLALAVAGAAAAQALVAGGDGAAALRERHGALQESLRNNAFGSALHLDSVQNAGDLRGDVYAVVEHPFETLSARLGQAGPWCDVLILHLNVKQCRSDTGAAGVTISIHVGRKYDQPLEETHQVDFIFRVVAATPEHLHVTLRADSGPLGTRDYRIMVQATPLPGGRSFMHMSYSYGYGVAARLAMQAYLGTLGSGKVGFTVVGRRADGQPEYVGGVRGVVERNTMRYYLAIDAYLASLGAPAAQQFERRLQAWFAATEAYALQLREMSQADYLAMKRKEIARKPSPPAIPPG
jgi:hypothetical protein